MSYSLLTLLLLFVSLFPLCFGQDSTVLWPGATVSGSISSREWRYYELTIPNPPPSNKDLEIVVTTLSGDPDLYADWNPHPNAATAPFFSLRNGEDSITLVPAQFATKGGQKLYIGVYGFVASSYSIVYTLDTPVVLQSGQPIQRTVHAAETIYFDYTQLRSSNQDLLLTATTTSGRVSVYISNSGQPQPTLPNTYQWHSPLGYSGEVIRIANSDIAWPADGKFHIAIYGETGPAAVSVTVTPSSSFVQLQDGLPVSGSAPSNTYAYYKYENSRANCELKFTLTSNGGDPDLFVSRTASPQVSKDVGHFEKSSTHFGSDEVVYSTTETTAGTYFIAVYAADMYSTFQLLGHASNCPEAGGNGTDFIVLRDGIPQSGLIIFHSSVYYRFTISEWKDVTIAVTRRFGDPDLFIVTAESVHNGLKAARPSRDNYIWKSENVGPDLITIPHTDKRNGACTRLPCTYFVAVYASTVTSYHLTASSSSAITTLSDGLSVTDFLPSDSYEYFRFVVAVPNKAIRITVTPIGRGDPDVYVSNRVSFPNSTDGAWDWKSTSFGSDTIVISPLDPKVNHCPLPCTYYVSVFAAASFSTSFQIMASLTSNAELQLGLPQAGHVDAGSEMFYQVRMAPGYGSLVLTVNDLSGRSDVYVSNSARVPDRNDWSTYVASSYWWFGRKVITISENTWQACQMVTENGHQFCVYSIAVFGASNCSYNILAAGLGTTTLLQNGIPVQKSIAAGQWAYFLVRVDWAGFDLSVITTAISGDPDMYESATRLPTDRPGEYDHMSDMWGSDSIDLENVAPGNYYFGVKAFTNTTFSILSVLTSAGQDSNNFVTLLDGAAQSAVVHTNHWRYYRFAVTDSSPGLTISVTRRYGDPDVYVLSGPANAPMYPSQNNYTWASISDGSDILRIENPPVGTYWIGVTAFSTSSFSIQVSTDSVITQLVAGSPTTGRVLQGRYKYYSFVANSNADLTISVSPQNGDPDLYVSVTDHYPTKEYGHYNWSSGSSGGDSVNILRTDPKFCVHCTYYIAVHGFFTSDYTITVSFNLPTMLSDGVFQSGSLPAHAIRQYYFHVPHGASEIRFQISPTAGNPRLLVSRSPDPSPSNAEWSTWPWFFGGSLIIHSSNALFCSGCTYYVAVEATTLDSNFTVVARSTVNSMLLNSGVSYPATVPDGDYSYFRFRPSAIGMDVVITITALNGDPDLYVSARVQQPSAAWGGHEWSSQDFGSDVIAIKNTSASMYYIGVYGFGGNSSFYITAYEYTDDQLRNPISLVDGIPQLDAVADNEVKYYRFFVSGNVPSVTFTVSARIGDPDLYVALNQFPDLNHPQWRSEMPGSDEITINNPVAGQYYIGIRAFTTSVFTITAHTPDSLVVLQNGSPRSGFLPQRQYKQYVIYVNSQLQDLTISVTPTAGDPDLFVADFPNPDAQHFNHSAVMWGADSVVIPAVELKLGPYYIAVYASTNCTYTLVASFSNVTVLHNRGTLTGLVGWHESKYYLLELERDWRDFTVTATSFWGSVYLYVAQVTDRHRPPPQVGDRSSYDYSSTTLFNSQTVTANTGVCYRSICRFWVMVYGNSRSSFMLTAATANASVELQANRAVTRSLPAGQYHYFYFYNPYAMANITLTLTAVTGDPDIYVSGRYYHPSIVHREWWSDAYGSDTVHISYHDADYRSGYYYIAVFDSSANPCTYSLLLSFRDASGEAPITTLFDGQPISATLRADQYNYYRFELPLSKWPTDLTISVTPSFGDPDLYINSGMNLPSSSSYSFGSSAYGRDSVIISPDSIGVCVPHATRPVCVYTIGVYAFARGCAYSIVASTYITQLRSGVPVLGYVEADKWKYFSIYVDRHDAVTSLTVSLTAFSGDPDLYVRLNDIPDDQNPGYSSSFYGSDIVTVSATELRVGSYFIGVKGFTNSSFSVSATIGAVQLVQGEPHNDMLLQDDTRYYTFTYVPSRDHPDTLSFQIDSLNNGRIDMFVNNNNSWPTPEQARWKILSSSTSRHHLTVPGTDPAHCRTRCVYRIMLRGASFRALYAITAAYGEVPQLLSDGHPVTATPLQAGQWQYFRAVVNSFSHDVNIAITEFYGDVTVYVDQRVPFPNATYNQGMSVASAHSRGKHVSIPVGSYKLGFIFIAVYGNDPVSSYSIAVATRSTLLSVGYPQIQLCRWGGNLFFFNHDGAQDNQARTLTLHLSSESTTGTPGINEGIQIFVGTSADHPDPRGHAQWTSNLLVIDPATSPDGATFTIPRSDPNNCPTCTFYVNVHCPDNAANMVSFALTASTDEILMFADDSRAASAAPSDFAYFQVPVRQSTNFSVIAEPCRGDVKLFVSQKVRNPRADNAEFQDTDSNTIKRIRLFQTFLNTNFFIGVQGVKEENQFRLTTSISSSSTYPPYIEDPAFFAVPATGDSPMRLSFAIANSQRFQASDRNIMYSIYASPKEDRLAVLYTVCGVMNLQKIAEFRYDDLTVKRGRAEIEVTGLKDGSAYELNIVASDMNGVDVYGRSIYQPLTVLMASSEGSDGKASKTLSVVLGIGIPAVILFVIALIYLSARNRKLTQELAVEMHDIPKAAVRKAVRDPAGYVETAAERAKSFDRLLAEEAEQSDTVDSGYKPPQRIDEL